MDVRTDTPETPRFRRAATTQVGPVWHSFSKSESFRQRTTSTRSTPPGRCSSVQTETQESFEATCRLAIGLGRDRRRRLDDQRRGDRFVHDHERDHGRHGRRQRRRRAARAARWRLQGHRARVGRRRRGRDEQRDPRVLSACRARGIRKPLRLAQARRRGE